MAQHRVLYLHGFASSPLSRKAQFFAERLQALGYTVEVPALDEGNFRDLTVTRQLDLIERTLHGEEAILIGSSLGGYLAALYASRHPEVERLILLAPAFRFRDLWEHALTPEQKLEWQQKGSLPMFHYKTSQPADIGYGLFEDAARHDPYPDFHQPALIFHGTNDQSVPVEYSAEFAHTHPNCRLVRLTSGHELTDVLDGIWAESEKFLAPPNGPKRVLD